MVALFSYKGTTMKTNLVGIRYIGRKPQKTDNVADTGAVWQPGQVINFPMDVARKFLSHNNVWAMVDVDPNAETHMGGKKTKATTIEPVPFVNINEMDINTLAAFARVEFNQTIDVSSDIADARNKVLGFMTNAALDAEADRLQAIADAKSNTHYIGLEVGEEEYQAFIAGWSVLKLVPKPDGGAETGSNQDALSDAGNPQSPEGGPEPVDNSTPTEANPENPVPASEEVITEQNQPHVNDDTATDPLADLKANLDKLDKKALREMCKDAGLKVANTMDEKTLRTKLIAHAEGN